MTTENTNTMVVAETQSGLKPMNNDNVIIDAELVDIQSVINEVGRKNQLLSNEYENKIRNYLLIANDGIQTIHSKLIDVTYAFIQIGNILKIAKSKLSKDDFTKLKTNLGIEERMAQRYVALVKNKNVAKLTKEDMKNLNKPSMSKLVAMSRFDDEKFELILNGDDTLLKKAKAQFENPNPNILTKETYDNFMKEGFQYTINAYAELLEKMMKLEEELSSNVVANNTNNTEKAA